MEKSVFDLSVHVAVGTLNKGKRGMNETSIGYSQPIHIERPAMFVHLIQIFLTQ